MSKKDKTKSGLPHFDGKDRSTFKPFATVATDVLQKRKRKFEDSKSKKFYGNIWARSKIITFI